MANIKDDRQELVMTAMRDQYLPPQSPTEFVLTDIDIPFGRAVSIMLKWMLAAIPAGILATIIVYGLIILFGLIIVPHIGIY